MDDAALLAMWLASRPPTTRRTYGWAAGRLWAALGKSLVTAELADLQRALATFDGLAPRSRALGLAATRSLFAFLARAGQISADPSSALLDVTVPDDLAERLLSEGEVEWLIASVRDSDRVLLRLLYTAGLRVSEACGLTWRQVISRGTEGGQISVVGKGGKARSILVPSGTFRDLVDLKVNAKPGDRVFPITAGQVRRIVKRAAKAAGLSSRISPHWLRHAHASHALDRGAPVQLLRDTLGHASIATTDRYAHARPRDSSARYLRGSGLPAEKRGR